MRNTDSESDAESDADTESVVVDESADSGVWDAVKPDSVRDAVKNLFFLFFVKFDLMNVTGGICDKVEM